MAVYTALSEAAAAQIAAAHRLGALQHIEAVPAGSVNSNYMLHTDRGRFLRIYEEQQLDGVRYEWRLLAHLQAAALPVPARVLGPEAGVLQVAGKPVAVFQCMPGEELCQASVTTVHLAQLGAALARVHRVGREFLPQRPSRFAFDSLTPRLADVASRGGPALAGVHRSLCEHHADLGRLCLPAGDTTIHGDLFRDNVRWQEDAIVGILDWESASWGRASYDLMTTLLAWCYGDDFDWTLAQALVGAYRREMPLNKAQVDCLHADACQAALRFTVTRITDFTLRTSSAPRVIKDHRRFLARLERLRAMGEGAFLKHLRLDRGSDSSAKT
ncbi:MAG: homoserine kinase [Polyangiales bacterium]